MKLLLDDGDEHVGGDGAPDLCLHGVLAGAQESLDTQVLLDPFEEQLDLPATFVERGNRQGGQRRVVGQKDQRLARFGVFESDAPQVLFFESDKDDVCEVSYKDRGGKYQGQVGVTLPKA